MKCIMLSVTDFQILNFIYFYLYPQMKRIQARESGAVYRKRKKVKDELLKQNEGSLLKYVTQGENQNEILPRSDNALNQTAEREISVNVKDVNRGDDKLQVAQSDDLDEEEDNSNLS